MASVKVEGGLEREIQVDVHEDRLARAGVNVAAVSAVINTFSTTQIPVVEARISAPGIDLSGNYDLLEKRVVNPITRVPGVAKVELNGVEPNEVRINLRLGKIAEHGVDLGDLAARLMAANRNVSLGKLIPKAKSSTFAASEPSTTSATSNSFP